MSAVEYTSSVERLRTEYLEMREEHFGFSDLYAKEWDRIMADHDAVIWDEGHLGYDDGQTNPYREGRNEH